VSLHHLHRSDAAEARANDADNVRSTGSTGRGSVSPNLLDRKRFGGRASRSRN
jgi:hypothetical protein